MIYQRWFQKQVFRDEVSVSLIEGIQDNERGYSVCICNGIHSFDSDCQSETDEAVSAESLCSDGYDKNSLTGDDPLSQVSVTGDLS